MERHIIKTIVLDRQNMDGLNIMKIGIILNPIQELCRLPVHMRKMEYCII